MAVAIRKVEADFRDDNEVMKSISERDAKWPMQSTLGRKSAHPCLVKHNPLWVKKLEEERKLLESRIYGTAYYPPPAPTPSPIGLKDGDTRRKMANGDGELLAVYQSKGREALFSLDWQWPVPDCIAENPDYHLHWEEDYVHKTNLVGPFHFAYALNCGCLFLWNFVNLVLSGARNFRTGKYLVFTWVLENHRIYRFLAWLLAVQPIIMVMTTVGYHAKKDIEEGKFKHTPSIINDILLKDFTTIFMTLGCGFALLVVNRHGAAYANIGKAFTKLEFKRNIFQMLYQSNDTFETVISHACMLAESESKDSHESKFKLIKEILDEGDDELDNIAKQIMAGKKDLGRGGAETASESVMAEEDAANKQEAADQLGDAQDVAGIDHHTACFGAAALIFPGLVLAQ